MSQAVLEKIQQGLELNELDVGVFFTDTVTDAERMNFLLMLNSRGVNANDIAQFVKFLTPRDFPQLNEAIDICGTGGSGLPRINTSTISAFILSAAGVKIAKHGNRAASGRFGSFDLLESLGMNIDLNANQIQEIYESEGLVFIFAQKFFPAMRYFATVRKEVGVPTIFNILGPLLNPANIDKQIIGTNSLQNAKLIAEAGEKIGRNHVISVAGSDGLDDVTLTGNTHCVEMKYGKTFEYDIEPSDFGLNKVDFKEISSQTPEQSVDLALSILKGGCKTVHNNLVLASSAFTLVFNEIAKDYKEGIKIAKKAIEDGSAYKKFETIKTLSNKFKT